MNLGKINKKTLKKRILLAPLDWGLGHATRCIPLVKLLIKLGAEPILAAEGSIASLLQKEFPDLIIIRLKGYKVKYSKNKNLFFFKMLSQAPGIIKMIKYEKSWLNHIITTHEIDGVISDNRFGLYSNKVPCIFITHQLAIQTGNAALNTLSQKINYSYINKFSECWVPDLEGTGNIAGTLSHPQKLPGIPVKYLGILSRFEKKAIEKDIDLLVMISGPEPQRSIFETILFQQLKDTNRKVLFLRGMPATGEEVIPGNKNISILNHVPAATLNEMVLRSKLIITRCGYSTIMDLIALNQKAILVPTPGQTEQEWLAKHLMEKKIFYTVSQEHFSLEKDIENMQQFDYAEIAITTLMNEHIVAEWLNGL